jgi:fermentation-respiration switch protein FrsA (DUF1100 family)
VSTRKPIVYKLEGMDAVTVRRDIEYAVADSGPLTMDLYLPPDTTPDQPRPAIVFVTGFSDVGAQKIIGCRFKEMESSISWARLTAASGIAAITYATGADPATDARAVVRYVRDRAAGLGVDEKRLGLWACSGHVPNALSLLMEDRAGGFACAALCYGFMLDAEGSTIVADASRTYRFVNPCVGKSIAGMPRDTPLFIVRAGRDEFPGLNDALDGFVASALSANLPVTVVNYAAGPHAFDIVDDSDASREVIEQILAFLRRSLRPTPSPATRPGRARR